MKIAVLGPVFLNVDIQLDDHFDEYGTNKGRATTSYNSPCMDLALKLSTDNKVTFLTSLDTGASVYIKRILNDAGVNTDYITYQHRGLGFNVNFIEYSDSVTTLLSYPFMETLFSNIKVHANNLFDKLDAVITSEIDAELFELCQEYSVPVFWLSESYDKSELDDDQLDLLENVIQVTPSDCIEKLKEVCK